MGKSDRELKEDCEFARMLVIREGNLIRLDKMLCQVCEKVVALTGICDSCFSKIPEPTEEEVEAWEREYGI